MSSSGAGGGTSEELNDSPESGTIKSFSLLIQRLSEGFEKQEQADLKHPQKKEETSLEHPPSAAETPKDKE